MTLRGDTVRFQVQFKGYDGLIIQDVPSAVYFRLYDGDKVKILEQTLGISNEAGKGIYYYDYSIPNSQSEGIYIYEFEGIFNGKPFVSRDEFTIEFS